MVAGVARLASTDIGAWSALLEEADKRSRGQKSEKAMLERRFSVTERLIFIGFLLVKSRSDG